MAHQLEVHAREQRRLRPGRPSAFRTSSLGRTASTLRSGGSSGLACVALNRRLAFSSERSFRHVSPDHKAFRPSQDASSSNAQADGPVALNVRRVFVIGAAIYEVIIEVAQQGLKR